MTAKKFLHWFDKKGLLYITGFLLVFIPLYPKIPIFSPIEKYIVRVRLEDFFVFFAIITYGIQLYRKKIDLHPKLSKWILAYIGIGTLSLLSALFIIPTIPLLPEHILKSTLHLFRYIEYFSVFFITYAAIRSKKDVLTVAKVAIVTLVLIIIYGI